MKFLIDAMHGRIARYLRILGYDTYYSNDISDTQILELAQKENRILITRDIQLAERAKLRKIPYILLKSTDFIKNFYLIYKKFSINLNADPNKSRCPVCNSELTPISKEFVKDKIPQKTFQKFNEFWICKNPKCQKIYYYGMHWEKIKSKLEKIKNYIK